VSELYGVLDPATRDWTDGLLSKLFRELNEPLKPDQVRYSDVHQCNKAFDITIYHRRYLLCSYLIHLIISFHLQREARYIVFDGDVDAKWVENMNSVMDDNKLLTLPNGERIRLENHVKLLFEVC